MKSSLYYSLSLVMLLIPFFASCQGNKEFTMQKSAQLKEMLSQVDTGSEPAVLSNEEIQAFIENLKTIEAELVEDNEYAVMETSLGIIIFEFFPDSAANHCANFKKLANSGYYDWTLFHRVIPQFMIQGGDILSKNDNPSDDGTGGPGYTIDAEFSGIPHKPGIVSTARSSDPNSAGSQFFIMHGTTPHLDGQYTVFGRVVEGLEVVNSIATAPRDQQQNNRPLENIYIKKVRVFKLK